MPTRILRDWTDSVKFDGLSPEAERLFIRLIMKADDYGRFHANPKLVRAACFPLAEDLRANTVAAWLTELSDRQLVFCYTSGTGEYLAIPNFRQRLQTVKSRFPPPDGFPPDWTPIPGEFTVVRGSPREPTVGHGGKPPESEAESESDKETDKDQTHIARPRGRGPGQTLPGAETEPGTPTTPVQPTLGQVKEFAALPTTAIPAEVADDFWHANEACGWLDHLKRPIADWKPALVMFHRRGQARRASGPRGAIGFRSTPAEHLEPGLRLPTPNDRPVPRSKPRVF